MNAVNLSEKVAVIGFIAPDANGTGDASSNEIDMSLFERIMAVVMVGDLGASATVDFKFQGSLTAGGSYSDITGAAITQLTKAGTDDNKTAVLELKAESLAKLGYRYIKGILSTGTAASDSGVLILGSTAKYGPASLFDIPSGTEGAVDEIKVV